MNNIESLNLDSLMGGGGGPLGGYPALLGTTVSGSSLGLANGSLSTSSTVGVGQGMLSSSSSGSDSLLSSTLDDFVSGHHLGQGTNGISGHSSSNSHLSNHNASTSVSHSHPELAAHLTTSTSGHYINSTASNSISTTSGIGTSSGGSVGSSSSFNLDQFDSIDATSCQLLQSYSIIKDDDYALLVDDEDLVGSLMLGSSGLTVPDHMGVVGGHSISEHLTAAQYNLLEDCLDHITSSESGLGSSMATSSTSIATSIATSSTLNQLNSTLNSSVLNTSHNHDHGGHHHHQSHHSGSLHQGGVHHHHHHEPTLNQAQNHSLSGGGHHSLGVHSDHQHSHEQHYSHQYDGLSFDDCGDLVGADELTDTLASVVTTSAIGHLHSNGIVAQAMGGGGGGGSGSNSGLSTNTEDLLTPILTTVTSSSAGVVATTTTNVGHQQGLVPNGGGTLGDQLMYIKEEEEHSNTSGGSLNQKGTTTGKTPKSKKAKEKNSKSQTNLNHSTSSMSSVASSSAASNSSSTPTTVAAVVKSDSLDLGVELSPSSQQGLKEEICRLTVCPLCDNTKSFCSSSSVTRHLRSVHKLNDLLGTRNCYCLLCARFMEDNGEFFAHLKKDHLLLQQAEPISSLYVRHVFKSFDDFLRWKTTELEKQTGCKYERCFTNEHPRSIYFKCAAIRITRITLAGKQSTSCKEPPPGLEMGCKGSPNGTSSSGSDMDVKGSNVNGTGGNPNEVVLESTFDARMYPCTSSIRLMFRYTGIEAIEFPYHLGHKLEPNLRDLCLSHVSHGYGNLPTQQHVVHLNATSTTTATVTQQGLASPNGANHYQTQHIQIKSEVIPGGQQPQQQQTTGNQPTQLSTTSSVVSGNGPKTTTTKTSQIVIIPSKTPTTVGKVVVANQKQQQHAAAQAAAAQGKNQNAVGGSVVGANSNSAVIPAMPSSNNPQAKATAQPKPRKRNRSQGSTGKATASAAKAIKLEPRSETTPPKVLAQGLGAQGSSQVKTTSSSSSTSPTFLPFSPTVGGATSSPILTTINANTNTITLTPISLTPQASANQPKQATLALSGGVSSSAHLKSPMTNPLEGTLLIDNLPSDIFLDSFDEHSTANSKTPDMKVSPLPNLAQTAPTRETDATGQVTTLIIKQYEDGVSGGLGTLATIKAEETEDSKESLILPPAAPASGAQAASVGMPSTAANGNSAGAAASSGGDDGLGIVPLEKAMQMVGESIRPRKELLRKRFNELLDLCITESDMELVESTVEQLISTNLLQ